MNIYPDLSRLKILTHMEVILSTQIQPFLFGGASIIFHLTKYTNIFPFYFCFSAILIDFSR